MRNEELGMRSEELETDRSVVQQHIPKLITHHSSLITHLRKEVFG